MERAYYRGGLKRGIESGGKSEKVRVLTFETFSLRKKRGGLVARGRLEVFHEKTQTMRV